MKKIVESYKRKLASEEGWVLKRGAKLRIALCYPNVYSIGMANLGFQAMYELFNNIPEVSCERVFLPDSVKSRRGSSPTVREGVKGTGEHLPYAKASNTEFSRNSSGYDHALPSDHPTRAARGGPRLVGLLPRSMRCANMNERGIRFFRTSRNR